MKSVWKSLVQCAAVIGVSANLSAYVVAQDAGSEGIVRIASKPGTRDVQNVASANGSVRPVNAMMENCTPPGGQFAGSPQFSPDGMGAGQGAPAIGQPGPGYGAGAGYGPGCPTPNGLGASGSPYNCPAGRGGYPGYGPCGNPNGAALLSYLRCKFGYFIPTGGGGKGIPWVGCYARVYPVNPYYRDSRDGQMWGAQGYGMPMAVPLAPVVSHTYDLSWGIPSSRLTPVSTPAY